MENEPGVVLEMHKSSITNRLRSLRIVCDKLPAISTTGVFHFSCTFMERTFASFGSIWVLDRLVGWIRTRIRYSFLTC